MAVIDTERGSAALYSGNGGFVFDHLDLTTHEPETLVAALAAAGSQRYDVVIIDSLSHFWMGVGGMLEQADNAKARDRGPFGGWKAVRPMERRMIEALLAYPGHVIVTMRTKTDWVLEKDDNGRDKPRRIGLKAEQREGIEYEFDLVGDMDLDHMLIVSKSRCSVLADAAIRRPDEKFGQTLRDWLQDGAPTPVTVQDILAHLKLDLTVEQVRDLYEQARNHRLLGAAVSETETLGEVLVSRGKSLGQGSAVGDGKMSPEQMREHDQLVREATATTKKAKRETKPSAEDIFAEPQTDESWLESITARINECGSMQVWRGLAAEVQQEVALGHVAAVDADLLDKRLTAREIELGEVAS